MLSLSAPLDDSRRLRGMLDVVPHRGPDGAGYLFWQTGRHHPRGVSYGEPLGDPRFREQCPGLPVIDSEAGRRRLERGRWDLFLGHRRLAVLDPTPNGHQPMGNRSRSVWITYNGCVYNFRELRDELTALGHEFVSRSDTEVLIHAYEEWGIQLVERLNGMFAFALWDAPNGKLYLVRDRYGIKPLYYYRDDKEVVFGSEVKSIQAYSPGGRAGGVDLLALNEYFSFQNVFSTRTLFPGIRLLPPATVVTLETATGEWQERKYWDFEFRDELQGSRAELSDQLRVLIQQAVERQCVSDVPLGTYLSGGLDSGAVTAIAAGKLGRIPSFTGGFDLSEAAEHELHFDERRLAEKLASLYQTEHYEFVLHAGDMEAAMERLVWHLEDLRVGQCYPNYYMSRLAGKFVKVVLSGAGGDELFGGYPWRYAAAVGPTHAEFIQNYYKYWKRLVTNQSKLRFFNADTRAALRELDDDGAVPFKDHTLTTFKRVFGQRVEAGSVAEQVNQSLYFECKTFLHGLLVVEDKLAMAHSLETRLPLLDNDVVDFACRLPVRFKLSDLSHLEGLDENLTHKKALYNQRSDTGKSLLRAAMERILPPEIAAAKKQGFSAPDESWFRGRSADYVRDTIDGSRLSEFLDMDFVRDEVLAKHMAGERNSRLLIWSLLSFATWLRLFD